MHVIQKLHLYRKLYYNGQYIYSKVKKNHFMNKFNVSFLNLSDIKSIYLMY